MGTDGSVAYLFKKVGVISYGDSLSEGQLMEPALEAGADDISSNGDGSIDVITEPESFIDVKEHMISMGLEPLSAEITFVADQEVKLGKELGDSLFKMVDLLEDLDDVQKVYTNASIDEEISRVLPE